MRIHIALFILTLFSTTCGFAQVKAKLTLQQIWASGEFYPKFVNGGQPMKDGNFYSSMVDITSGSAIVKFKYKDGKAADTLLKETEMEIEDYSFSPDENKILFSVNSNRIYRHSVRSDYYIYDRKSRTSAQITKNKLMHTAFSPDNRKLAYVRDNNLYIYDLETKQETAVTTDGKVNEVINGSSDWVHEEEFAFTKAFSWSPTGSKIAFYKFDERQVKEFSMDMFGALYPSQYKFKYPKAGEANSVVTLHVFDLLSQKTVLLDQGPDKDQYIPRMGWTMDNNIVWLQRLNRLQNKFDLLLANASDGTSQVVLSEKSKTYIDINDNLTFLKNGKQFIFSSEQDGYHHIYLYELNGKLINQVTKGDWDIDNLYGIDEKKKLIYYSSSEVSPMERHIYSVSFDGKTKKKLSLSPGTHSAAFNSDFSMYLNTWSSMTTPPVISLNDAAGKQIRVVESNDALKNKLTGIEMGKAEFFRFKTPGNYELNGWMIKPVNFNSSTKYPVMMFVYGGPGSQTVNDRWGYGNYLWYQYLAQQGFIVVSVDNRGTGFRGEEFKKMTYLQLGKYETEDQTEAAKYLGTLPFVDGKRVGIFGWSYGGYMSTLCLSKSPDVFKAAIAVAPVTNWRYYDNIYTERFMRTPQENGKNYDDNSPINHIGNIKGKFLLVHGTADDNVHFQNSVELVDAMIKKNIKFDSEYYPNKNHSIGGGNTRLHLYTRMTEFLLQNL